MTRAESCYYKRQISWAIEHWDSWFYETLVIYRNFTGGGLSTAFASTEVTVKVDRSPSILSKDVHTILTPYAHVGRNPLECTWFINLPKENINALSQIGISIANGLES
ncbi:hypothetical protein TNCT_526811 [Trichonephila clavata]|uniref:Uncharacterized protein n=1 Tax=Trichonephila clavata TaxID=2740835 RepID=A0A8X6F6T9_TRICU|nr:hypothetical protein TNCT_526811 [Trichonephila clavata]